MTVHYLFLFLENNFATFVTLSSTLLSSPLPVTDMISSRAPVQAAE